jgi:hypothetical protein
LVTKICKKCKLDLDIECFQKYNTTKNGKIYSYRMQPCKDCKSIYMKNYALTNLDIIKSKKKIYYHKNINKIKEYRLKNKEHLSKMAKEYRAKNLLKLRKYDRDYWHKNKTSKLLKYYKWHHLKLLNDPVFKLRNNISKSIFRILKENGSSKKGLSIINFLQYTLKSLRDHIEKQFEDWMTWDNWGMLDASSWKWNLDHIIPQSDLPYTSMTDENFKKCWALENLRPYSAKQNIIDGVTRVRHKKNE